MMMNDNQLASWVNMWLKDKEIFPEFQDDKPAPYFDRDFDMKVTLRINGNDVSIRGYFTPKGNGNDRMQMDIDIPSSRKIIDDGGQLTAFKADFILSVKRLYTSATTMGAMQ